MSRVTNEQFINRLILKHGKDEYFILSPYKKGKEYILVRHKCGYEYKTRPDNMLSGRRCPKCFSRKFKKPREWLENELLRLFQGEYTLVGKYNASRRCRFMHSKCGKEIAVREEQLRAKQTKCYHCNPFTSGGFKKSAESLKKLLFQGEVDKMFSPNEYIVCSGYKGAQKQITIQHRCGNRYVTKPTTMRKGSGCRKCAFREAGETTVKNKEGTFKIKFNNIFGNEYILIGKYAGWNKKISVMHIKCGSSFFQSPTMLMRGCGCLVCRESKGERAVRKILKSLGVNFVPQYWFSDCRFINPLRFDFAIIKGDLVRLIEYNGYHHYQSIALWGSMDKLINTIQRDVIKRVYCSVNSIPLLEIPYTCDFNMIEKLVTDFSVKP